MTEKSQSNPHQKKIKKDSSSPKIVFKGRVLPLSEYEYTLDIEAMAKLEDRKIDD
jgi:hypothetical protein